MWKDVKIVENQIVICSLSQDASIMKKVAS